MFNAIHLFSVGLQWLNELKKNYFQSKDLIKTIIRKNYVYYFSLFTINSYFFCYRNNIFHKSKGVTKLDHLL